MMYTSFRSQSLQALRYPGLAGLCLSLALSASPALAATTPYSPHAGQHNGKRLLWGDTHLHTDLSLDARAFGVRLDTATAYRFARGEQVIATHGQPVRLARPLDFLVVSDHSDGMGVMKKILDSDDPKFKDEAVFREWGKRLLNKEQAYQAGMDVVAAMTQGSAPKAAYDKRELEEAWAMQINTAEQYNEPGRFTALIGYEWTSTPQANNLHRNVLYRDGAKLAGQITPFTVAESSNPFDLWQWMANYERQTGGKVLALAHNGNMSNGLMFPDQIDPATNKPFTDNYLKQRARWEPLYEVTQIKGDGEAHPFLSPNDEFADFENWDTGNMGPVLKQDHMLQGEYAREALKNGLKFQKQTGTNPYQFGMIGSTDSHTALATADSDNFFGKMSYLEPKPNRWKHLLGSFGEMKIYGWEMVASGYAAVWAEDNTREAIFDAMQRREVYATTGPRIGLRFDLVDGDQNQPMGSVIPTQEAAPVFKVEAMMDPIGAKLDRIEIIKGWVDAQGNSQEKIYTVAWAGKRTLSRQGTLKPLASTVNANTAEYSNTIGSHILSAQWQDPDFTPQQTAFYYARVLEIPTPRWSTYDMVRFGVKMDGDIPTEIQERAYSSPIWIN